MVASIIECIALIVMVVAFCAALFLMYLKLESLDKKITSINRENPGVDIDIDELVNLAIANWRLEKNLEKMAERLDSKEKKRLENVSRQFGAYLSSYNVKAEDYTGRRFSEGMNIDIRACENDDESEWDYIKETEKPAIYVGDGIYKRASVIIARGTKEKNKIEGVKKEDGEK